MEFDVKNKIILIKDDAGWTDEAYFETGQVPQETKEDVK